jgi:hypothetical protein
LEIIVKQNKPFSEKIYHVQSRSKSKQSAMNIQRRLFAMGGVGDQCQGDHRQSWVSKYDQSTLCTCTKIS